MLQDPAAIAGPADPLKRAELKIRSGPQSKQCGASQPTRPGKGVKSQSCDSSSLRFTADGVP